MTPQRSPADHALSSSPLSSITSVVWINQVLSVGHGAPECRKSVGTDPYIECVFENDLVELDAAETLAAAEANEHTLITAETRRLQIAAHWADLDAGDAPPSPTSPPPNSAASCASPTALQPG